MFDLHPHSQTLLS